MTKGMRWRVLVLQVGLIGILVFAGGFLFWAHSFSHNMVQDQMSAQKIYFPPAGSKALSPTEFPDLQQYAGQQVVNGDQAKAYADGFIGRHLTGIANGQTYSQVSAASVANPKDAALAAQANTLFKGEALRGLLLNAYGWWQVGQYAFYAAVGMMVAAGAVAVALLVELGLWLKTVNQEKGVSEPTAQITTPHPVAS